VITHRVRRLSSDANSFLISLACLAMVLAAACARDSQRATSQEEGEAETLALGRQLTDAFFAGELEPLWNSMTAEMRDAAGRTMEEFEIFRKKVDELAGQQTSRPFSH
jgi:hypothetical protein